MKLATALLVAAALMTSAASARASIVINIDKSAQEMTVIRDGEVVDRWPVSTARRGYSTPSGTFKPFRMEAEHTSDEWDDAPMPHSIFFTMQGHAIHGSYETKHLGSPASHGCVRISPAHATELFAMVKADGMANTRVIVTGEGGTVASRQSDGETSGVQDLSARFAEPTGMPVRDPVFFTPTY